MTLGKEGGSGSGSDVQTKEGGVRFGIRLKCTYQKATGGGAEVRSGSGSTCTAIKGQV